MAPDAPKSDELTPEDSVLIRETLKWMQETFGETVLASTDNDWTYIVKLHAMIETALNDVLTKHFQAPDLGRVIAKLDTSNPGTGKVAFAKALKILAPQTAVFIQKLSELRNLCVHDIRNFKFDLDKYLTSLSKEKRSELMKPILKMVRPEMRDKLPLQGALYIGTMSVMIELFLHHYKIETRALESKLHRLESELYKRAESTATKE